MEGRVGLVGWLIGCFACKVMQPTTYLAQDREIFWLRTRDLPNIRFVFTSVPNSGPNSVFVFGRIVSSERIRIVSLYSAASDVYSQLHSVSATCSHSDRLIFGDDRRMKGRGSWLGSMQARLAWPELARDNEVVNIRAAGVASKRSAGNIIRILIRPNSLYSYLAE